MNIGGLISGLCNATVTPDYLYDKPMDSSSNEPFSIVPNVDSVLMPTLLLIVNHLLNKLDELDIKISLTQPSIDILAIAESWLDDSVSDNVCSVPNYSFFRRDRKEGAGGGVVCYVKNNLNSREIIPRSDDNFDHEILMIAIRPRLLPRPLSLILVIVIYCPPWYDSVRKKALSKHITSNIDTFKSDHPDA